MKIKMTNEAKAVITLEKLPAVRAIQKEMLGYDEQSMESDAQIAARVASGINDNFEILKIAPEFARNIRVWNFYGNFVSFDLDIWLTIWAFNPYIGFFTIGVYLSDIWQVGGGNDEEIREHMFIQKYKKVEE